MDEYFELLDRIRKYRPGFTPKGKQGIPALRKILNYYEKGDKKKDNDVVLEPITNKEDKIKDYLDAHKDDNLETDNPDDYIITDSGNVELKESVLLEIRRQQIVDKSKNQSQKSKERFKKRTHYQGNLMIRDINLDRFFSDDLIVATAKVGDYFATVAFQGVLSRILDLVKGSKNHTLVQKLIIKAVSQVIDDSDLLINCDCDDFKYRFAYWATTYGYKWGKQQNQPPKYKRTNMDDISGSCCKHLLAVLSNKNWVNRIAIAITDYVEKQGIDKLRTAMGYDEVQLPSEIARELGHKGAYAKMYNKQFKDQDDQEWEELRAKEEQ